MPLRLTSLSTARNTTATTKDGVATETRPQPSPLAKVLLHRTADRDRCFATYHRHSYCGGTQEGSSSCDRLVLDGLPASLPLSDRRRLGAFVQGARPDFLKDINSADSIDRAEKAPKLNFTVVINPNNGPGGMTDLMHFKPALQKLAAFPNVQTIGYVPTNNGTRSTSEVQRDVLQYSVWSNMPLNCTVNGIFFDQTPYLDDEATEIYLDIINNWVRSANGIRGPKTIIPKPADLPGRSFGEDVQYIEDSYEDLESLQEEMPALEDIKTLLPKASDRRENYSITLNSMPESADMEDTVRDLSKYAQYLFVTDLEENDMKSFGKRWMQFVDAMEKLVGDD